MKRGLKGILIVIVVGLFLVQVGQGDPPEEARRLKHGPNEAWIKACTPRLLQGWREYAALEFIGGETAARQMLGELGMLGTVCDATILDKSRGMPKDASLEMTLAVHSDICREGLESRVRLCAVALTGLPTPNNEAERRTYARAKQRCVSFQESYEARVAACTRIVVDIVYAQ